MRSGSQSQVCSKTGILNPHDCSRCFTTIRVGLGSALVLFSHPEVWWQKKYPHHSSGKELLDIQSSGIWILGLSTDLAPHSLSRIWKQRLRNEWIVDRDRKEESSHTWFPVSLANGETWPWDKWSLANKFSNFFKTQLQTSVPTGGALSAL